MEILPLNPHVASISCGLSACLPALWSHISVLCQDCPMFSIGPPYSAPAGSIPCWWFHCVGMDDTYSPMSTHRRWIKNIDLSHSLSLCRLYTGLLQRAPYAMSERYSTSKGKLHSLELCYMAILMLTTAWFPWDRTKGYAHSKLSGYQYLLWGMLTQSQINFNYSLIIGSDANKKSEPVCLISKHLVKLNNLTNNKNKNFHDWGRLLALDKWLNLKWQSKYVSLPWSSEHLCGLRCAKSTLAFNNALFPPATEHISSTLKSNFRINWIGALFNSLISPPLTFPALKLIFILETY